MKNKGLALGVAAVVIVLGALLIPRMMQAPKNELVVKTEGRVLDYGFKLKINDCVKIDDQEMVVVDVDNKATYVLAEAKRYYAGPYPITEDMLTKVDAKEADAKPTTVKLECEPLEKKHFVAAEEEKPVVAEATAQKKETKKPAKKKQPAKK